MSDAWDYWNHYNALPKRVAFKDGKLLAFMATHAMDEDEAEDDAAYSSASKLADMYPDEFAEYEEWEDTDEGREEGANFFEWLWHNYPKLACNEGLREHTTEEWWDRQDSPHHGIPVGFAPAEGDEFGRWAYFEIRDGKPVPISFSGEKWRNGDNNAKDGYTAWYDNGQKKEEFKDGKRQMWHSDGSPELISENDFTISFRPDGSIKSINNYGTDPVNDPTEVEFRPDGSIQNFNRRVWKDGETVATTRSTYATFNPDGSVSAVETPHDNRRNEESAEAMGEVQKIIAKAKRRFPNVKMPEKPAFDEAKFKQFLAGS